MLGVILGSAELMKLQVAASDPMREELRAIEDAVQSATRLARQLLAFGRLAADAAPVCVNLSGALGKMEQVLQRAAGPTVGLRWTLDPDAWCVKIDPSHFEQIALNLVVNARDAMPHGGTIEVATTNATLTSGIAEAGVVAGRYVVLTIGDTGIGMDERTRQRIFEPFFTTKGEGKGTGLGSRPCSVSYAGRRVAFRWNRDPARHGLPHLSARACMFPPTDPPRRCRDAGLAGVPASARHQPNTPARTLAAHCLDQRLRGLERPPLPHLEGRIHGRVAYVIGVVLMVLTAMAGSGTGSAAQWPAARNDPASPSSGRPRVRTRCRTKWASTAGAHRAPPRCREWHR